MDLKLAGQESRCDRWDEGNRPLHRADVRNNAEMSRIATQTQIAFAVQTNRRRFARPVMDQSHDRRSNLLDLPGGSRLAAGLHHETAFVDSASKSKPPA